MQINDSRRNKKSLFALGLLCAFLHLAIAPNIALFQGRANFALIFAMLIAFSQPGKNVIWVGFLSGLFFDLTTSGPVGLMAFELTCATYYICIQDRNRMGDSSGDLMKTFIGIAFVVSFIYGIAMLFVGVSTSFIQTVFLRCLPTTILDCIAFIPFMYVLGTRGSGYNFSGNKTNSRRGANHLSTKGL